MNIKSVYSIKGNVEEVFADIKGQLEGFDVKGLIYFASSFFQQDELSKLMYEGFSSSIVFGCSSSGEIVSGKMLKNSVVAMAFNSNVLQDIKLEVVEDIKDGENIKKAFKTFGQHYNEPMEKMDYKKYVGIVLMDGLSGQEEKVMDKIGDLTNVTFIGGSAGDDLKFEKTNVYANGKVYTNAAVLALIKSKVEFEFVKTQSFCALSKQLTATKVNEKNREVLEFDGKPAAQAYAEAIGSKVEEIGNKFMTNPVGVLADNEIFVRSPQQVKGDSIIFYCNILEGMEVSLLKSTDIIKDTEQAIKNKVKEMGTISGIINFSCILRTLELEQKGKLNEYGEIFTDISTVGFSTYGEAFIGHINQTATMLLFK